MSEVVSWVQQQPYSWLTTSSFWNGPNEGPDKSDEGGGVDLGSPPTHRFQARRIADQLKVGIHDRDIVVLVGYSLGGNKDFWKREWRHITAMLRLMSAQRSIP